MRPSGRRPRTVTELHREWLELVDTEGPFLAIPPLKRVYPQGIPALDAEARAAITDGLPAFAQAWDDWDRSRTDAPLEAYREARDAWLQTVLVDALGWDDDLVTGDRGVAVTSPDHRVTVRPSAALVNDEGEPALLVSVVDPVESLRDLAADTWATSPIDRLDAMLRQAGVPVGVVTDGRWWAVVSAIGTVTASGVVDALTWVEEGRTRDAFLELLSVRRTIGGAEADRLPTLFQDSVAAAEEITVALGTQVRRAVELLVSAFSEAEQRTPQQVLPADGDEIYSAAVTVMMRVVFLLFAEERGLLPQTSMFAGSYGFAGVLDRLETRVRDDQEESLEATYATWHRLLATSNALYHGASFEDVRLPAYGGSLFDPAAHAFLSAADDQGRLQLLVDDRVMLHVLRSVQQATVNGESRRISFRDVDVEQIGYIYEGLLGYTCRRADEVILGVLGSSGAEPEVPLAVLGEWAEDDDADIAASLIDWVKKDQQASKPSSPAAYVKALRQGDALADADRALLAVTPDADLRDELRGWIGIIRRDLRNRPTVILPGGLLVVETPSRKNAGAHYTPKSLAAEVVKHALDPLCYSPGPLDPPTPDGTWTLKPSYDILDLRIADIACGSGAFLVSAATYLADRVVEAWTAEGTVTGTPAEMRTRAIRLVVSQCLFGADINTMAIEMCKLSLWLVSLDPKLPFSFVDDKVFVGNSLLGLVDDKPLRALLSPSPQGALVDVSGRHSYHDVDLDAVLTRARRIRERLASEVDESDPQRSTTAKRHLMREYDDLLDRQIRPLADAWMATQLRFGGKPGKPLREAMESLGLIARRFLATGDQSSLDEIITAGLTPNVATDYVRWEPLHWCLEVPEVMGKGGFDAVIGNPPFLGGQKLTGAMGTNVRDWFVHGLAEGKRGSADLIAYFFLRIFSLLSNRGTLGLIATNTVAQGDTREVGLDRMVARGFTIHRAIQSQPWPSQSANLEYAAVWGSRRSLSDAVGRVVDGTLVPLIGPNLAADGGLGPPQRLKENEGISFQGCIVLGMGFVVTEQEASEWIEADPRNAQVLFPYVNGEDLTSRPAATASRWVIDFDGWSEAEATSLSLPFEHLRKYVKPERARNNRLTYRARWWLFAESRPEMRAAVAGLDYVLALARVSDTLQAQRVATGSVLSEQCVILASESLALIALLCSTTHLAWTQERTSSQETRIRYAPSDVFLTLPRPPETPDLHDIGRTLDEERREIMLRRSLGLTKLYNLVHDPSVTSHSDVLRLREIHQAIDVAVLDAYGWSDIPLDYGFHTHKRLRRWSFGPTARAEVLRRLTEENHRRAALE